MGRPPGDLDDYLDWQERLEGFKASGLSIDEFCLQEGVSRSTYYRWVGHPPLFLEQERTTMKLNTMLRVLTAPLVITIYLSFAGTAEAEVQKT